jgi:hypothetical protein
MPDTNPKLSSPAVTLMSFGNLEGTEASVLNYNLPTSTAFVLRCFVPISVPAKWLKPKPRGQGIVEVLRQPPAADPPKESVPPESLIGRAREIYKEERRRRFDRGPGPDPDPPDRYEMINDMFNQLATRGRAYTRLAGFDARADAHAYFAARNRERSFPSLSAAATGREDREPATEGLSVDYHPDKVFAGFVAGMIPVFANSLYGKEAMAMVEPGRKTATLFVIEDYEIASYLGDYGAGRTLKTFSLLPGEKTTITIKSWRSSTSERSRGENVLDSFSADSAAQYEQMADQELRATGESQDAAASGWTTKDNKVTTEDGHVSGGFNVKIGPFGGNAEAGYNTASTGASERSANGSSNSLRKNTVDALTKAMDRHVSQSSSARKFEVNTETNEKTSTTEGIEESTVRELSNINHSRVLNFVFRQLNQEYFTITYLKDVAVGGTWGEPGDGTEARLDAIEGLIARYVRQDYVEEVKRIVLNELNNVYDYEGKRHAFIDEKTEDDYVPLMANPDAPMQTLSYFRKDPHLEQTYRGKSVKGVILDVTSRILVTDALVVEALLGQGEALDSYNMRLQGAAGTKAEIANGLAQASVEALAAIKSGEGKADAIAKISYAPASPIVD